MLEQLVKDYHIFKREHTFELILQEVHSTIDYKVRSYNLCGYDYNDKYQEGCIALLSAIEKYKPNSKAKFLTYLSRVLDNHMINLSNSALVRHQKDEVEATDEVVGYFVVDKSDMFADIDLKVDILKTSLSEMDINIVDKLIFEDKTTTDTAKELDLSKGRVSQRMKQIKIVLENELKLAM